jgi:hypothetical protein
MHEETSGAGGSVVPESLPNSDHGARVAAAFGIHRSPHWEEVAREHLARQPRCVCCLPNMEFNIGLQVHHIFPFHYCIALGRADLELDERNLITLCGKSHSGRGENHHLWVGHLDNFQSSNLSVVRDAKKVFYGMPAGDFKSDRRWLRHWLKRLNPLELMNERDRAVLLALMDRRMPK